MKELKMVFYGEPVAQGRPRFTTINGFKRAYDPVKSRNFKQWVRLCAIQVVKQIDGFKPFQNACIVDVTFYRHIPSSWSKKKRIEADSGVIRPVSKKAGDIDNSDVEDTEPIDITLDDDAQLTLF